MSGRRAKRRSRDAPMPATGAGLLRFFEAETAGVHIRPEVVLILAVGLIVASILVEAFL